MASRPTRTVPLPDTQSASSVRVALAATTSPRVHAAPCASSTALIAALSAASTDWVGWEANELPVNVKISAANKTLNVSAMASSAYNALKAGVPLNLRSLRLRFAPVANPSAKCGFGFRRFDRGSNKGAISVSRCFHQCPPLPLASCKSLAGNTKCFYFRIL